MYSADWATDTTQLRGERPGWNYFRGVEFAGISALWRAGQALVIVSDTKVIVCAKTLNDMRTIESSFGVSLELNDY